MSITGSPGAGIALTPPGSLQANRLVRVFHQRPSALKPAASLAPPTLLAPCPPTVPRGPGSVVSRPVPGAHKDCVGGAALSPAAPTALQTLGRALTQPDKGRIRPHASLPLFGAVPSPGLARPLSLVPCPLSLALPGMGTGKVTPPRPLMETLPEGAPISGVKLGEGEPGISTLRPPRGWAQWDPRTPRGPRCVGRGPTAVLAPPAPKSRPAVTRARWVPASPAGRCCSGPGSRVWGGRGGRLPTGTGPGARGCCRPRPRRALCPQRGRCRPFPVSPAPVPPRRPRTVSRTLGVRGSESREPLGELPLPVLRRPAA